MSVNLISGVATPVDVAVVCQYANQTAKMKVSHIARMRSVKLSIAVSRLGGVAFEARPSFVGIFNYNIWMRVPACVCDVCHCC